MCFIISYNWWYSRQKLKGRERTGLVSRENSLFTDARAAQRFFQAFSASSNSWMRQKNGNSESASPTMPLNHRGSTSSCAKTQIHMMKLLLYPSRHGLNVIFEVWPTETWSQLVCVLPHLDITLVWNSWAHCPIELNGILNRCGTVTISGNGVVSEAHSTYRPLNMSSRRSSHVSIFSLTS